MVNRLRECGARVIAYGNTLEQAARHMREVLIPTLNAESLNNDGEQNLTQNRGDEVVGIELHPFDHERIWEGNSTIVDELAYQLPPAEKDIPSAQKTLPLDAIVCSVGGGGLMNGIIEGLKRQERMRPRFGTSSEDNANNNHISSDGDDKNIDIIATETQGAESLARSISAKSLVQLSQITSSASSLGATRVAQRTLENALHPPPGIAVHSSVLHDSDAARGVLRLAEEQKLLVELACGVSVQVAIPDQPSSCGRNSNACNSSLCCNEPLKLQSRLKKLVPGLKPSSRVVIVVCGGSNINLGMLNEWKERLDGGWSAESEGSVSIS